MATKRAKARTYYSPQKISATFGEPGRPEAENASPPAGTTPKEWLEITEMVLAPPTADDVLVAAEELKENLFRRELRRVGAEDDAVTEAANIGASVDRIAAGVAALGIAVDPTPLSRLSRDDLGADERDQLEQKLGMLEEMVRAARPHRSYLDQASAKRNQPQPGTALPERVALLPALRSPIGWRVLAVLDLRRVGVSQLAIALALTNGEDGGLKGSVDKDTVGEALRELRELPVPLAEGGTRKTRRAKITPEGISALAEYKRRAVPQ